MGSAWRQPVTGASFGAGMVTVANTAAASTTAMRADMERRREPNASTPISGFTIKKSSYNPREIPAFAHDTP
jgi:hypothetical protein